MTGSGPKLGVLLLLAVLLQTVVVTITVLHFTSALNSVRSRCGFGTGDARTHRIAAQRARDPPGYLTDCSVGSNYQPHNNFQIGNSTLTFISSVSRRGSSAHFMMSCNYQPAFCVRACARPWFPLAHLEPVQPDAHPVFTGANLHTRLAEK